MVKVASIWVLTTTRNSRISGKKPQRPLDILTDVVMEVGTDAGVSETQHLVTGWGDPTVNTGSPPGTALAGGWTGQGGAAGGVIRADSHCRVAETNTML